MATKPKDPTRRLDRLAAEIADLNPEDLAEVVSKAREVRAARGPAFSLSLEMGEKATRLTELDLRIPAPPREGGSSRQTRLRRFLEREIWPQIPLSVRGKSLSKQEVEAILGYGPEGV